jgi:hypothetical protein
VAQDLPQVYTPAEFDRLQRALDGFSGRYSAKSTRRNYPLSGRIICGCGAHWTGRLNRGLPYYACSRHPALAPRPPHCDWTERRWLQAEVVERNVEAVLRQNVLHEAVLYTAVQEYADSLHPPTAEELADARRAVDTEEEKLAALYDRITDLDPGAFKKVTRKVWARLDEAKERLEELQAAYVEDLDVDAVVSEVKGWFDRLDLGQLATALDLKVKLTGYETFELDYAVSVGSHQVRLTA